MVPIETDFRHVELPELAITYFKTFEQRERAFRQTVHTLIPRKYAGPWRFWKDFTNMSSEKLARLVKEPIAWVPCNPRDCLAFATPLQVLTAARLNAIQTQPNSAISINKLAADFGIQKLLHQPVRTLSGGETVKVAMAKAYIASFYVHQLAVASPFTWLSEKNRIYFEKVCTQFKQQNLPAALFSLEEEDSIHSIHPGDPYEAPSANVNFTLLFKKVRLSLSSSLNLLNSDSFYVYVSDFEKRFISPCLLTGDNGQGKSLLARILSKAVSFQGVAEIESDGCCGTARLLFQDVMTQTLLRTFESLAVSPQCPDGQKVFKCYDLIVAKFKSAWHKANLMPPETPQREGTDAHSLLEIKMMLAAVRLNARPSALILDEPDWGLTRAAAIALVSSIINVAHQWDVPVILISHKPWWRTIAQSRIRVKKTDVCDNSFSIDLHASEVI
ncbi:hypothetical protein QUF90_11710 [Desulfococcaceae bacterium HSG9]|nr:hypothetical protein [Desulfococcaceae bacterium HSG9]